MIAHQRQQGRRRIFKVNSLLHGIIFHRKKTYKHTAPKRNSQTSVSLLIGRKTSETLPADPWTFPPSDTSQTTLHLAYKYGPREMVPYHSNEDLHHWTNTSQNGTPKNPNVFLLNNKISYFFKIKFFLIFITGTHSCTLPLRLFWS